MAVAVPMVEIFRGEFLETVHTGHAVIAHASGEVVEAWGDPALTILPRSSAKMIQALPLIETGAALTSEQLALACGSHAGETRHVARVRTWLADLGLDETALRCGPTPSRDPGLRDEMIRTGQPATRVFNTCSGKHAGFLTLSRHLGAGPDYVDPAHPVQAAVRSAFEDMCGEDSPGFAIDGCSAPNFATSLAGFARAMARFAAASDGGGARDRAAATLRNAMIRHPQMVSGQGCACARIMEAAKGRAAVKTGAEGVFVAIIPDLQMGIALKIADGADRASEIAVAALLVRLRVLDPADPEVASFLTQPIRNWDGLVTGSKRPAAGLLAKE